MELVLSARTILGTVAGAVPADEWWDFGYKALAEANVSVSHEVVAVNGH